MAINSVTDWWAVCGYQFCDGLGGRYVAIHSVTD